MVVLGEHPNGGWICDCGEHAPIQRDTLSDGLPGYRLADGPGRYLAVTPDVQEVAMHATVVRDPAGGDMRAQAARATGRARTPVKANERGRAPQTEVAHPISDDRQLVDAALEAGGRRVRVPVREVEDGDVVERGVQPGNRFAGEVIAPTQET